MSVLRYAGLRTPSLVKPPHVALPATPGSRRGRSGGRPQAKTSSESASASQITRAFPAGPPDHPRPQRRAGHEPPSSRTGTVRSRTGCHRPRIRRTGDTGVGCPEDRPRPPAGTSIGDPSVAAVERPVSSPYERRQTKGDVTDNQGTPPALSPWNNGRLRCEGAGPWESGRRTWSPPYAAGRP